jgi:hypothetical protein
MGPEKVREHPSQMHPTDAGSSYLASPFSLAINGLVAASTD